MHLPNIEELTEVGQIKVGVIPKLWCIAATADDEHNNLAMLVHREGEALAELLTRLDLAIAKARTEDVFTDGINRHIHSETLMGIRNPSRCTRRTLTEIRPDGTVQLPNHPLGTVNSLDRTKTILLF